MKPTQLRVSFARCPAGRRLVTHGTAAYDICENINECAEFSAAGVPLCRHGLCRDLEDGYVCHCDPGYVGVDCSTRLEAASWSRSSTFVVVTSSVTLFLGSCLSNPRQRLLVYLSLSVCLTVCEASLGDRSKKLRVIFYNILGGRPGDNKQISVLACRHKTYFLCRQV